MNKILNELKNYKYIYVALLTVIILGSFLRLYNLGENSFVADEFLDVNATYGYHKLGEWQAWDFNHNQESVRDNKLSDKRAWVYRWQVSQLYKFKYFPPTEFTIRLVSALWGIFTIAILYFVTLSFTKNRWIALISAFLWATSVPAIEINRKIRMYSMFAPIFLILSWTIFQFIEISKQKTKTLFKSFFNFRWVYLLPVLFFGLLAAHLHQLTGNITLAIFVYCLIRFFVEYRKKNKLNRYIFYVTGMIFVIVIFSIAAKTQFEWLKKTLVFFEDHWNYFNHIGLNYGNAVVGWFLMFMGSWYLMRKKEISKSGLWIFLNFMAILLAAVFVWARNVGPQYIFFIQSFGLILTASGIFVLAKFIVETISSRSIKIFSKKIKLNEKQWMSIIVGIFLILTLNVSYFFQENNTYHLTSSSDTPNYRKVFDYVKRNYQKGDVMITRNFRNYYYNKLDIPVFDFGSERSVEDIEKEGKVHKITLEYVKEIVSENPSGWVVFSDNDRDFITKEAREYFDDNFEKVTDSSLVRGRISVYRWIQNNMDKKLEI
ncbi:MAG: hypothetical protein KAT32_02060 [Candidatus Moranbacteria bacterium]|nr:hypothetical protein [Candidatus Moranbacteria bacterium]